MYAYVNWRSCQINDVYLFADTWLICDFNVRCCNFKRSAPHSIKRSFEPLNGILHTLNSHKSHVVFIRKEMNCCSKPFSIAIFYAAIIATAISYNE